MGFADGIVAVVTVVSNFASVFSHVTKQRSFYNPSLYPRQNCQHTINLPMALCAVETGLLDTLHTKPFVPPCRVDRRRITDVDQQ